MQHRLISLAPSNTEILFALGAHSSIVGATHLCDFPPEAKRLPKIGSWTTSHDFDAMERLKPTLLLASMYVPPSLEKWAAQKRIPLFSVCPVTLDGIYKSIEKIGSIVGMGENCTEENCTEENAKSLVLQMKSDFAKIEAHSKSLAFHPKIYCEEFHSPPFASANWVPEIVRLAGGIPFSKEGIFSHPTSLKKLQNFSPDLIVLHWCGFGERSAASSLAKRDGWGSLSAVQGKKIFPFDDSLLNRPSPRLVLGAQKLQQLIIRHQN